MVVANAGVAYAYVGGRMLVGRVDLVGLSPATVHGVRLAKCPVASQQYVIAAARQQWWWQTWRRPCSPIYRGKTFAVRDVEDARYGVDGEERQLLRDCGD